MRNIIRVLLNEGIEREDILAICKYIKEEYEVVDETTMDTSLGTWGDTLDRELRYKRGKEGKAQEQAFNEIEKAEKEKKEYLQTQAKAQANAPKYKVGSLEWKLAKKEGTI